jgi:chromate transporter
VGGGLVGAILMTVGMFLPAFSFTLIGHNLFERLVKSPSLVSFLDGVTGGVIGLIFIAAFQLLKSVVNDVLAAILFLLALGSLYLFQHRITGLIVIVASAIVGQVIYIN